MSLIGEPSILFLDNPPSAWTQQPLGTASGGANLAAIFQILPFLSGAFVPTDAVPGWLQAFTANQPMTLP